MQKNKSIKYGVIINLIKCALIGVVATLVGVVCFAIALKFANISSTLIAYINNIIKILSIFVMVLCLKRKSDERLLIRSIFVGIIYAVLSFSVFSILNGKFDFNMSLIYDILFAVCVSILGSITINMLKRKTVW